MDGAVEKLLSGLTWSLTAALLEAHLDASNPEAPCRVRLAFPPPWRAGFRASQQPPHCTRPPAARGNQRSAEPRQQGHAWQDLGPAGSAT